MMFPRLALIAKDYYSAQRMHNPITIHPIDRSHLVLASTAPVERLFSAAGNAQERHQARMSPETLQAVITLREWWKPRVLGFDSVVPERPRPAQ
jgi:hypothetical protein